MHILMAENFQKAKKANSLANQRIIMFTSSKNTRVHVGRYFVKFIEISSFFIFDRDTLIDLREQANREKHESVMLSKAFI